MGTNWTLRLIEELLSSFFATICQRQTTMDIRQWVLRMFLGIVSKTVKESFIKEQPFYVFLIIASVLLSRSITLSYKNSISFHRSGSYVYDTT